MNKRLLSFCLIFWKVGVVLDTRKLFISIPMRDRDIDDIRADMQAILCFMETQFNEDFELIDSLFPDDPPADVKDEGTWYLGRSISLLSEADLAVFDSDWRDARGCIIEHMVCALYNIPYVDMSVSYDLDEDDGINDETYDINEAARLNEVLSKMYEEASGEAEDFEDALGFEHDDISDLVQEEPKDISEETSEEEPPIETERDRRKKRIADILKRRRGMKHSEPDEKPIVEEVDDIDKLEPGEYDADAV